MGSSIGLASVLKKLDHVADCYAQQVDLRVNDNATIFIFHNSMTMLQFLFFTIFFLGSNESNVQM